MKKSILSLCSFFICIIAFCQEKKEIAIIPEPMKIVETSGEFLLPQNINIDAGTQPEMKQTVAFLQDRLSVPTGYHVTVSNASSDAIIHLLLNKTADNEIGNEGYRLSVLPKEITIKANQPAGLFYGVQTLVQLFPKEIEGKELMKNVVWSAPCVEITDYPRFGWRGLMFDVARHFFSKEDVEKYIDQMARYKFNLLHLHLTDDQGWRIEIKSLPNLTKVGAWNVHKVGQFGGFTPPAPDEPRNFGGFYTQDDMKEIIRYAKERFIDIMPEVDVPGHSLAAVAAYPELSCTPGADKYHVNSGESFMDWSHGAPPIALVDNTLCPANEKVYAFLDKVFTELAALFPFQYIHVGGDECPKNFWEKSADIKALMQKEGLKTQQEVQSYFEKRVEKIVESKGKKLIGWDEILEGGLAPGAAVMSWRGIKGGTEAAKMGHQVVMSPTTYCYIDYMQADPVMEPHIYATLRLSKAYQFEPVPDSVDPKFIKGGQANLWTEQVYNIRHAEYMTWPRAFATVESVWSPKEKKNWNDFAERVQQHFARLDVAEIKYDPAVYDPIFKATKDANGQLKIELSTEIQGLDIYYSFDNSFPDRFYPKYTEPLVPPKDATTLKVITYKGKQPVGRLTVMPIKEMEKRAEGKSEDED
jgi:hexosaminidase